MAEIFQTKPEEVKVQIRNGFVVVMTEEGRSEHPFSAFSTGDDLRPIEEYYKRYAGSVGGFFRKLYDALPDPLLDDRNGYKQLSFLDNLC